VSELSNELQQLQQLQEDKYIANKDLPDAIFWAQKLKDMKSQEAIDLYADILNMFYSSGLDYHEDNFSEICLISIQALGELNTERHCDLLIHVKKYLDKPERINQREVNVYNELAHVVKTRCS